MSGFQRSIYHIEPRYPNGQSLTISAVNYSSDIYFPRQQYDIIPYALNLIPFQLIYGDIDNIDDGVDNNSIPFKQNHQPLAYRDVPNGYNTECSICLEDFKADDQVFHTKCQHTFHCACIGDQSLSQCPNCRTDVSEHEEE